MFAHTLARMSQDEEHLNLLSIFHYVIGGLASLIGFLPLIHTGIGAMILFSTHPQFGNSPDNLPATWVGLLFMIIGGGMFLVAQSLAICLILAGRFISRHTHHSFVLVLACIQCLFFPFGTVLGVFTLIVLIRPSVKALFGCVPSQPPPPTPPAL